MSCFEPFPNVHMGKDVGFVADDRVHDALADHVRVDARGPKHLIDLGIQTSLRRTAVALRSIPVRRADIGGHRRGCEDGHADTEMPNIKEKPLGHSLYSLFRKTE